MTDFRDPKIPADCILIDTDGSCIGNPGPGGWAASIRRLEGGVEVKKRIVKGGTPAVTTNNRMELTPAIQALKALRLDEPGPIIIRSDSEYLIKGMTEWTPGWIVRGWRTAGGKPVGNRDLWEELLALSKGRVLRWFWVRGHDGNHYNEEVDLIATNEARAMPVRRVTPIGQPHVLHRELGSGPGTRLSQQL